MAHETRRLAWGLRFDFTAGTAEAFDSPSTLTFRVHLLKTDKADSEFLDYSTDSLD